MNDIEQRKIFSNNLRRYVDRSGKTQKEIAEAIGVSAQTFNTGIILQPLNPEYTPIICGPDNPATILGVVVELRRKV